MVTADITHKRVKDMVVGYMTPRIEALKSQVQEVTNALLTTMVRLTGGISGEATLDSTKDIVTIPTSIVDDTHTHTAESIAGSVSAVPGTIVKRDADGNIHGSGVNIGDTGYKLANGQDISTLFRNISQAKCTATTRSSGTGDYVSNAQLTIDADQKITLSVVRDNYYTVSATPDITNDGCN